MEQATAARVAAATLVVGLIAISCSTPQPTESPPPAGGPELGQADILTATPQRAPDPSATSTPTPNASPLRSAPDFTLPQAGGPEFNLAEQLAQGPVVIAFFQRGGG